MMGEKERSERTNETAEGKAFAIRKRERWLRPHDTQWSMVNMHKSRGNRKLSERNAF